MNPQTRNDPPRRDIRVFLLIDHQPIYACGVQAVIARQPGLVWLGAAGDIALALQPQLVPDVVLVDADLLTAAGTGNPLAALRNGLPGVGIVVLGNDGSGFQGAAAAGAAALLAKSVSDADLVQTILAVHAGQPVPAAAAPIARPRAGAADVGADLTRRERDLLALMAQGLSNHDISGTLKIALPTVKFHIGNILSKLNAYNRTSAVLVALRHNLVELH